MNKAFKLTTYLCFLFLEFQSVQASTTKDIFAKYPNKYFIESGSYTGNGIQMAIDVGFEKIYSIELQESYYENCCLRFTFYPFVELLRGDSSYLIASILKEIDEPATFWLDGHYSGDDTGKGISNTPLLAELDQIKQHHIKTHTILIDDIRQFGSIEMDFITLDTIIEKIRDINSEYSFSFENGYIPNDILVAKVNPNK